MDFAGADKLRSRSSNGGSKRELPTPKDGPGVQIAAQTFTFRELAAATKNFRPESFIGEGGFGRVYKGRLESSGQVNMSILHEGVKSRYKCYFLFQIARRNSLIYFLLEVYMIPLIKSECLFSLVPLSPYCH